MSRIKLYTEPFEGCKETHIEGLPNLYYKPETIEIFGKISNIEPSYYELIIQYFLEDSVREEVYGYYCGMFSLNRIHGTSQMTMCIEIKSNKVTKEQLYTWGKVRYKVYPSQFEVNNSNHFILEILDNLENIFDYFESDIYDCISYIVKELKLTKHQFDEYLPHYSDRTKEVIEAVYSGHYKKFNDAQEIF